MREFGRPVWTLVSFLNEQWRTGVYLTEVLSCACRVRSAALACTARSTYGSNRRTDMPWPPWDGCEAGTCRRLPFRCSHWFLSTFDVRSWTMQNYAVASGEWRVWWPERMGAPALARIRYVPIDHPLLYISIVPVFRASDASKSWLGHLTVYNHTSARSKNKT